MKPSFAFALVELAYLEPHTCVTDILALIIQEVAATGLKLEQHCAPVSGRQLTFSRGTLPLRPPHLL